jgi:hypothetical protein
VERVAVARSEIRLANGDSLTVEASFEEAEKRLSDAARSGQSRLAWFTESHTDLAVGVNPPQVVSLKGRPDRR